jgi:alpha-glucuronidase
MEFVERISKVMIASREITVNYMTPIGLHHIMYANLHYGPGPWVDKGRKDWTSVYYHRADTAGIGFDRTSTGSNAVGQYYPEVRDVYEKLETCPENLLLWFHHVPWDYRLKSGRNVWEELCQRYNMGVDSVRWMQKEWDMAKGVIDSDRFGKVQALLSEQEANARVWRDACLLYFQTFSKRPIPANYEKPEHTLEYYKSLKYSF